MKVTKYPQSCLLLEKNGHKILIDPGNFVPPKFGIEHFAGIEAVLVTHQHSDHLDENFLKQLTDAGAKVYSNQDVAQKLGDNVTILKHGQIQEISGFNVMPHDLPHFSKPGVDMPPNTGYVIDGNFFHPGDGIRTNGVNVNDLAIPIAGAFTFDDTLSLAESVNAKRLIPIHYSNQELYPVNVNDFAAKAQSEFEVILLEDGQSTEL